MGGSGWPSNGMITGGVNESQRGGSYFSPCSRDSCGTTDSNHTSPGSSIHSRNHNSKISKRPQPIAVVEAALLVLVEQSGDRLRAGNSPARARPGPAEPLARNPSTRAGTSGPTARRNPSSRDAGSSWAAGRGTSARKIRLPWPRRNFSPTGIRAANSTTPIIEKRCPALQPVGHRGDVHFRHQIARQIGHQVGQAEGRDRVAAAAAGQAPRRETPAGRARATGPGTRRCTAPRDGPR